MFIKSFIIRFSGQFSCSYMFVCACVWQDFLCSFIYFFYCSVNLISRIHMYQFLFSIQSRTKKNRKKEIIITSMNGKNKTEIFRFNFWILRFLSKEKYKQKKIWGRFCFSFVSCVSVYMYRLRIRQINEILFCDRNIWKSKIVIFFLPKVCRLILIFFFGKWEWIRWSKTQTIFTLRVVF